MWDKKLEKTNTADYVAIQGRVEAKEKSRERAINNHITLKKYCQIDKPGLISTPYTLWKCLAALIANNPLPQYVSIR